MLHTLSEIARWIIIANLFLISIPCVIKIIVYSSREKERAGSQIIAALFLAGYYFLGISPAIKSAQSGEWAPLAIPLIVSVSFLLLVGIVMLGMLIHGKFNHRPAQDSKRGHH